MTIEEVDILATLREVVAAHVSSHPVSVALDKRIPHAALVATQVKYLQRAARKLPQWAAAGCIIPPLAFEQASSEATALHRVNELSAGKRGSAGNLVAAPARTVDGEEWSGGVVMPEGSIGGGFDLAIDLTCGLGVDAWALSRRFRRVIAVERDPAIAHLARVNFGLLGAHNITVVNCSAEEFVAGGTTVSGWTADVPLDGVADDWTDDVPLTSAEVVRRADLIYIDADRRGTRGQKLVLLEDCSPNVLAMMPLLRGAGGQAVGGKAPAVVLKLSPMFDAQEAQRLLGGSVEVVSLGGECREMVVMPHGTPGISAMVLGFGRVRSVEGGVCSEQMVQPTAQQRHCEGEARSNPTCEFSGLLRFARNDATDSTPHFLVVPDAALVKARVARGYFAGRGMHIESDTGFAVSATDPRESPDAQGRSAVPGRLYRVAGIERFDPKALRRELRGSRGADVIRGEKIRRADIMVRDFPLTAAQVAGQIGVSEGGATMLAFARLNDALCTIKLSVLRE